ncbi:cadherin-related family member 3-like [Stegostoma tigrinum]|uniref:cadherin-related family member 3-like n=1 Tax=Stegostoma tigrinum TaxID=3053191 RepID=UPI00286FEA60|nr:cadherin-related family member 3-like [Stegostoma tigrinum]
MWKTLSVFFLFKSLTGTHCAPTISGVNPLNLNLQEDAKIHQLLTTITVAVPAGDTLVGGPVIINADPAKYPFDIIPNATNMWDLVTTNSPKLDFETTTRYTLQLLVKDEKDSSASQTIIINILDVNEPPAFLGTLAEKDAEVYIAEDTAVNTPIYKVAAKDPDKNDVLTYSLSGMSNFQINPVGSISVANTLDYENTTSYSLSVKVEDTNGLFVTGVVKVFITNVNDHSPVLSCTFKDRTDGKETDVGETSNSGQTAIISLDEELAVGTVIATCVATDEDDMGDITYQLEPAHNYFAIDKNTGNVMVFSQMDRDLRGFQPVQTFTVKACDKNGKCADIPVRTTVLPINDNAPFCKPSVYRTTHPELLLHDTVVATLNCKDSDTPRDTLTYVPESGPLGPGMIFKQKTGANNVIQVGTKDLDYEDAAIAAVGYTYQMTIAVSDSTISTHTATATVIVEITPVNDFSPIFEKDPYVFDVLETTAAKHKIGRVIATDDDFPLNAVTYKIISGDAQIIKRFWIDPKEGTIELITQSDYESVQQYNLGVEATDSDPNQPKTAVTRVIINIIEENDEKPVCVPLSYKASILDNIAVGTNINSFRLNCQDRDSLDNEMRFEIVSGNVNNHFGFDPIRGSFAPKLILRTPFDYEGKADVQQEYHLIVNIIDDNIKRIKPRTGTVVIDITVVQTRATTPTTSFYNRKGLTIINTAVNTYNPADWYAPFLLTLLAILLALLFALGMYIVLKYTRCVEFCRKAHTRKTRTSKPKLQPPKKVTIYIPEPVEEKPEVVTEVTKYDTVFNGQAVDPVTGKWYKYNSATGARKWKEANESHETNMNIVTEKAEPKKPQLLKN